MQCDIITIFPAVFESYLSVGICRKAVQSSIITVKVHDLRDYTVDRHRTVDDYPYGGGPGMVMKPEPFFKAVESITSDGLETYTILLSPQGRLFNQKMARELSEEKRRLLFICGRYEAIDDRVREGLADAEVSVGDYVLTGGELPALVIIDSVIRLLPGALGDAHSAQEESFTWGILDYPQYTRPPEFGGRQVPEVLLSGNHREVIRWRRKEALRKTLRTRPDLLEHASLTEEDKKLISEIREEERDESA